MAEFAEKYETLLLHRERSRLHVTLNRPALSRPLALLSNCNMQPWQMACLRPQMPVQEAEKQAEQAEASQLRARFGDAERQASQAQAELAELKAQLVDKEAAEAALREQLQVGASQNIVPAQPSCYMPQQMIERHYS